MGKVREKTSKLFRFWVAANLLLLPHLALATNIFIDVRTLFNRTTNAQGLAPLKLYGSRYDSVRNQIFGPETRFTPNADAALFIQSLMDHVPNVRVHFYNPSGVSRQTIIETLMSFPETVQTATGQSVSLSRIVQACGVFAMGSHATPDEVNNRRGLELNLRSHVIDPAEFEPFITDTAEYPPAPTAPPPDPPFDDRPTLAQIGALDQLSEPPVVSEAFSAYMRDAENNPDNYSIPPPPPNDPPALVLPALRLERLPPEKGYDNPVIISIEKNFVLGPDIHDVPIPHLNIDYSLHFSYENHQQTRRSDEFIARINREILRTRGPFAALVAETASPLAPFPWTTLPDDDLPNEEVRNVPLSEIERWLKRVSMSNKQFRGILQRFNRTRLEPVNSVPLTQNYNLSSDGAVQAEQFRAVMRELRIQSFDDLRALMEVYRLSRNREFILWNQSSADVFASHKRSAAFDQRFSTMVGALQQAKARGNGQNEFMSQLRELVGIAKPLDVEPGLPSIISDLTRERPRLRALGRRSLRDHPDYSYESEQVARYTFLHAQKITAKQGQLDCFTRVLQDL